MSTTKRKPFTPGVKKFLGWLRAIVKDKGWAFVVKNDGILGYHDAAPIRGGKGAADRKFCPVCAVGVEKGVNPDGHRVMFLGVGQALGLSHTDAYDIAVAADDKEPRGNNAEYRGRLRKSLLKAVMIESK